MHLLDYLLLTDICEVVTVYSSTGRRYETSDRQWYGLSFCESGRIVYHHKGKKIVSDRNHAILLPKGATYYLRGEETGNFPLINFTAIGPAIDEFLQIPIKDPEQFFRDYERLKKLFLEQSSRAELMSAMYGILAKLIDEDREESDPTSAAVDYIREHLDDPDLSNAELAKLCGFSEVYLRKLFKEHRGTTPKQYILELRLKKAKEQLTNSGMRISEVADSCGFSSVYHFSRAFHSAVGMSPTEYSRQVRKI